MIGEIQQFNELIGSSQDNMARRASAREPKNNEIKPGKGIGMHMRQKDPLGSIVLSSSQSSSLQQLQQSASASRFERIDTKTFSETERATVEADLSGPRIPHN
mmetsp:Transcript_15718/g.21261  ORF Transcript_15718/g.21261 Transcript_15718/m.21261 type:complete len:103 (+) Transcript_15718:1519-1827(+)